MKHAYTLPAIGIAISLAISACIPALAQAQGVVGSIGSGLDSAAAASGYKSPGTTTDLPTIIGRLIGAALSLLGVLLLAYILYGGFLWMTAGGDEKKVTAATSVIKNAVIGLVIIVAAYAITAFILGPLGLGAAFGSSTATPGVTPGTTVK